MREKNTFVTAVILAAGNGSRMNSDVTKQNIMICGESVLHRCVRAFEECDDIDDIVLVCRKDEKEEIEKAFLRDFVKLCCIVEGGVTRSASARAGFSVLPERCDYVAIHDGARCLVTTDIIIEVISAARKYGAATVGTRVTDTVKRISQDGYIVDTIPRECLFLVQTPQVFEKDIYARALEVAIDSESITDDNMLVERVGGSIFCVDCGKENIKITTPDDVSYAEYLIKRRTSCE